MAAAVCHIFGPACATRRAECGTRKNGFCGTRPRLAHAQGGDPAPTCGSCGTRFSTFLPYSPFDFQKGKKGGRERGEKNRNPCATTATAEKTDMEGLQ